MTAIVTLRKGHDSGYFTRGHLEARMIARGYAMVPREDGNGSEVGGVSQDVMNLFSSRTRSLTPELVKLIDQYVSEHGRQPSKRTIWLLDQQAAQNTRKSKAAAKKLLGGVVTEEEINPEDRLKAWERQTTQEEIRVLSGVEQDAKGYAATAPKPEVLDQDGKFKAARIAVAEVSRHHAVWSLAELAFEANRALPIGASVADIDEVCRLATSGLAGAGVIGITAPDVVDARSLGVRERDGNSVFRKPNEERFTTTGQLDLEEKITELASRDTIQSSAQTTGRSQHGHDEPSAIP